MSFWVYILECVDDSYYVGHTDDMEKRFAEHQSGRFPGFTHSRLPLVLKWSTYFGTREEAKSFEKKIKGWSRAKKEALMAGNWDKISQLARRRSNMSRSSAHPSTFRPDAVHPSQVSGQSDNASAVQCEKGDK
jgi:predicted GIY-YIG superfamily endonuclease